MKKHVTKLMSTILALTLVASLAACAAAPAASNAAPASAASAAEPAAEAVELRVASVYVEGHSMNKVFTSVLEKFRADNPNVTISEEFMPGEQLQARMKTDAAAGSLPALFPVYVNATNIKDVKAGIWMNLEDELAADPEWKNGFGSGTLEQFQYKEAPGYWAAPLCTFGVGFFYNTELFAKAGVEAPKTWDDLLNVIDKLKGIGVVPWSLGAKDAWRPEHLYTNIYYKMNGIDKAYELTEGTIDYDDPSFLHTFEKMEQLVDAGAFDPSFTGLDYAQEVAAFAAGNVGMQMNGAWGVGETDGPDAPATIKGKVAYFPFPDFPGSEEFNNKWFGGVNDAFALDAKLEGAKKEAAIALLKAITSTEVAKMVGEETGNPPAVKATLDESKIGKLMPQVIAGINSADQFAGDLNGFDIRPGMSDKVYNYVQAVLGKMVTPQAACDELVAEGKKAS